MTYIVALTGGIGSGKTTLSESFKKIGVNIIDTDIISKNLVKYNIQISNSIKKKFGKKILNSDNSINRITLRKHIFNNKNDRIWIENLLHPKIIQITQEKIKLLKSNWCLWIVPLLFEKKLDKKANRILLIDVPIRTQIQRVLHRDKISFQEAKKIILLQTSRNKRISMSDDIIWNKKNIKKLNLYACYLNIFYTYLSKQSNNFKNNYLTKFY